MEWVIESLKPLVAGAVSGGFAAFVGFRSWVRRVDSKSDQVDKHEAQLKEIRAEMENVKNAITQHANREETSLTSLQASMQHLVGDVGYLRGWIDGQNRRTEQQ